MNVFFLAVALTLQCSNGTCAARPSVTYVRPDPAVVQAFPAVTVSITEPVLVVTRPAPKGWYPGKNIQAWAKAQQARSVRGTNCGCR